MQAKGYTLASLAELSGSALVGDREAMIYGVDGLDEAEEGDLSFLANLRYLEAMKRSKASAICVSPGTLHLPSQNYLVSENPSRAFQQIALLFHPQEKIAPSIHKTAVIDETAIIGPDVSIGPYAVVERGATVGEGAILHAHAYVGPHAVIGPHCCLYPGAIVRERCILGARVILQPGAVIGSCGFGYLPDDKGVFHKLEQLGCVVLEDDVEIGANATIDRARFKETRIHKGTKIDNLVQIAHNVSIGPHNAIAAQTGIAGSAKTGAHCIMGGQVGVTGHVAIASGVQLATRSGVSKSLKEGGPYQGSPVSPLPEHQKREVRLRNISAYVDRLALLEKRLAHLESVYADKG